MMSRANCRLLPSATTKSVEQGMRPPTLFNSGDLLPHVPLRLALRQSRGSKILRS
jgi:hypothetical protein